MEKYDIIDHTSDVAIRAYGKDLKSLFENCALGMFDIIADLEGLKATVNFPLECSGDTPEELLVNWLDELLYNFYTKGIIFCSFNIREISQNNLTAEVSGRHIGENRNRLKTEIKAVTYHDLNIKKTKNGLKVEIVFDV
jgi:SHS2 domain-containing protein